ncbi:S49 family peptidase [Vibrio sp. S4M6]|uniref:S49 family peptidase n=1 Tax=Vibrio sinus TaxID=2946865 RepID=UPI00202A1DD7|nr:S49 family peptidase [Vibrio sinus]MCL9783655.1 S49 family peptidase [Vibrio sinus]
MVRNLAHIANQAFNRPIALEPGYARVFYSVLASEMGIGRLIDGSTGEVLDAKAMAQEASMYRANNGSKEGEDRQRYYQLINGVAVLPVSGSLVHKYGSIRPYSGMTGYDGIIARLSYAIRDPEVRGVLMDFDTPGGQVAGCFDAADMISRFGSEKPVWSLGYDMHCSAGEALSSACSRRLITQTGVAGSVGVVMMHANLEELMKNRGAEITLIHSGAHKVDGNPYEKLPDNVRSKLQSEIDTARQSFAEKVAVNIGMDVKAVLDTEAATYTGQEAVDIGFADEVVNGCDAVGLMIEHLDALSSKIVDMGATMTKETNQPEAQAAPKVAQASNENTQPQIDGTAVATAERERVLGILGCDQAQGRQKMAHKLASMPSMSVDDAKELLASAATETSNDSAQNAIAAISAEHGEPLDASASLNKDIDSDEEQCAALVSAFGKPRG